MANVVKSHEAESPKWTSFPAFHTDNLERMMEASPPSPEALKIISFRLKTNREPTQRSIFLLWGLALLGCQWLANTQLRVFLQVPWEGPWCRGSCGEN